MSRPAMIEGWTAIEKSGLSDSVRRAERLRRGELLVRCRGAGEASGLEGGRATASSDVAALAGPRAKVGLSGASAGRLNASFLTCWLSSGWRTVTIAPHAGQRNFLPAASSLARRDRPQPQVTRIDIGAARLWLREW